jgi:hypothetical protein
VLCEVAARYGRPVFLTETSRGGPVEERLARLRESLELIDKLRTDGVPVVCRRGVSASLGQRGRSRHLAGRTGGAD